MDLETIRRGLYREYLKELTKYEPNIKNDYLSWGSWINSYLDADRDRECEWNDIYSRDGQIVGFIIFSRNGINNSDYFIEQTYIKQAYRRQGIMRDVLARHFKVYRGTYTLEYILKNEPALSFWLSVINAAGGKIEFWNKNEKENLGEIGFTV